MGELVGYAVGEENAAVGWVLGENCCLCSVRQGVVGR